MKIDNKKFTDNYFHLEPSDNGFIKFNDKSYSGSLKLAATDNSINIINYINLEDYLKGVISKEMPLGVGTANLEALKSLTICARTYATLKMKEGKSIFDIFDDTRDQMYGGKDAESPLSDLAVEETSGMILNYANEPAVVFYSSTCGGHTAAAHNVFTKNEYPYLEGVEDGNDPYCKLSTRYEWEEIYSKEVLIDRLVDAALLENNSYEFDEIIINDRFDCGRVDELEILLENMDGEDISVKIYGNDIRGVLMTGDGKSELWSTLFDISDEGDKIVIDGNGYGHGVGLCQWGAIYLSQEGWNYEDILEHYFPGTSIGKLND
ncbi:MAG: SpoIID/LytB domain-containing protein [Ignavibacteriaceae bacterium]|nr:SpoIID/LytB domain-containing protein [Ignavibacteriaceae bacterium]